MPEGLENIDDKAFYNSGLKKVAVPSSCKEYCFSYLDSLQQVELAEGAIDIPADAFKFCFALESARLPNSLKTIGDNAFHVCPKLSDVTIPEGVESIGQYAFRRTGIENLVIPESATKIDIYAFDGCQQLKTAVINAPLKRIPVGMFSECTSLETVNLPNSINSIGSLAFCNDNNFEIPALPENVSTIGLAAFAACKNTEEIVLPDSLYMLGEYCFEDVDVKSLDLSKTQLRMLEKNIFCNSQSLASVKLPSTLIGMHDNFYDCPSITLVDVPCQEPPVFELTGTGTFSYDVRRTATLVVPEGRENAYRTAEVWKDFTNLSTPTPIEGIGKDPADNNRRVYSIDGIRRQSMPKGIYVINGRKVVKE